MTEQIPPDDRYHRYDEKQEKDEKDRREAREKEEKGPSDRLSSAAWAMILIFAGAVLLAVTTNAFPWLDWENAWGLILMGAGVAVGLEVVLRLLIPEYRRPVSGQIVLAVVLFLVGLGGITGWENIWPIFLIGLGVSILIGALTRR
ncbi:MAG: hypothetical protein ACYC5O_12755 [Anaerolineae bacterium]